MENVVLQIGVLLFVIVISMTVHEMTHAFVGYWLGDDTAKLEGRLTFNPISHIDPFMTIILPVMLLLVGAPVFGGAKPVPFNPSNVRWGEFGAMLVGISGPFVNLVLAFIGFTLYSLFESGSFIGYACQLWVTVNIGFFLFNILPIPPLDGSRFLYYLAPENVRKMMAQFEHYGIIFIFLLVLLFSSLLSSYMRAGMDIILKAFSFPFGG